MSWLTEKARAALGLGHPFRDGWIPNRLDMGYDGTFKGYIYAPFKGRIIYAGTFNGWNNSKGVIIRCHRKLRWGVPTRCLYFTEGVEPVVSSGQHVKRGQRIARAAISPYGDSYGHGALGAIEWGVAEDGPVGFQTDAYVVALGTGTDRARSMVLTFARWARWALGVAPPSSADSAGRP